MGLMFRANAFATRHLPVKLARCHLSRPVASLTFDDFPRSAWTAGGPLLARYGARATYYAAGRFLGAREDGLDYFTSSDLRAVLDAGHEVGAHSYAHQAAPGLSTQALRADAERNDQALEPLTGQRMASYAYPFGAVDPRTKAAMGGRYASARGITPGINAGMMDLAQLRACPLESRSWSRDAVEQAVAQAVASRGWLIFFSHDVSDAPSPYGATPDILQHVLERLAAEKIELLPVRQAMARAVFGEG
jgi:peptidoglycan/xylan/chitin deacetylase (PgdA/CDA1 family)